MKQELEQVWPLMQQEWMAFKTFFNVKVESKLEQNFGTGVVYDLLLEDLDTREHSTIIIDFNESYLTVATAGSIEPLHLEMVEALRTIIEPYHEICMERVVKEV